MHLGTRPLGVSQKADEVRIGFGIESFRGKETLRQRTDQYLGWVNAYTKNQEIPMTWAEKDVRKKDDLAPLRTRMQREGRTGVYYVLKSMEQGPSFRIVKPKYPVKDPTWRIANIFGWRITKRTKGKHQVVLGQMEHGHHVLRAYSKNAFVKQYEKDNT